MNYTLLYSKSAAKDIKELDAIVKRRLKKKLEVYLLKPLYYAKKLKFMFQYVCLITANFVF